MALNLALDLDDVEVETLEARFTGTGPALETLSSGEVTAEVAASCTSCSCCVVCCCCCW